MLKIQQIMPLLSGLTVYLSCGVVLANPVAVDVYMVKMTAAKLINEEGDHLYFSINEFPSSGEAKVLRMPAYPLHWESRILPCVKNVKIWSGTIPDMQNVLVVFSVMDQTFPLFEDENVIGSVMVEITNSDCKINTKWALPDYFDEPKVERTSLNKPQFIMFGSRGQYTVEFKVVIK